MMLQAPPANPDAAAGLRDIHLPPAPSWWPPAPGWWLLAGFLALVLAWSGWRAWRRVRRHRRAQSVLREFDRVTEVGSDPSAALAAASSLLRRAARQHDPATTRLEGDAWLAWLDGANATRPFSRGAGRALADGMFHRGVDADQATAALRIARDRLGELLTSARLEQAHA
jgi:hypothetical protein